MLLLPRLEHGVVAVESPGAGPGYWSGAPSAVAGDDGIRRLFVADVDVLAREMREEGYAIRQAIRWSVPLNWRDKWFGFAVKGTVVEGTSAR